MSQAPIRTFSPRLPRPFFTRDAVTVARELLGQRLVRIIDGQRVGGLIVETEAYLGPVDLAAHSARGQTARNAAMWLEGGHAYVYFIYGMHWCANVVAGAASEPVAVLLRAVAPDEGLDHIRARRPAAARDTQLCAGPGRLCQALAIDRALNGADLTASEELFIERARRRPHPDADIVTTPRIGIGYAQGWAAKPLRFYLRGNPHVSRK